MSKDIPPKHSFKDECAMAVLSVSLMLPSIYNLLRSPEDLDHWRAIARSVLKYRESLVNKYDKDLTF